MNFLIPRARFVARRTSATIRTISSSDSRGAWYSPAGFNSGHQVGLILDRIALPYSQLKSFDELPTPFRCVATDLVAGKAVVFDHGSLSEALRGHYVATRFL